MQINNQNALLANLVNDKKVAEKTLKCLQAKASRAVEQLHEAATMLDGYVRRNPHNYVGAITNTALDFPPANEINGLIVDLQEAGAKLIRAEDRLRPLIE